jgi:FkbM family methyltransferase
MLESSFVIRRFVDRILKKVLNHTYLYKVILHNIDLQILRGYLGRDFLSPVQQFALEGYTEHFISDLPLSEDSNVLILGGYIGESAQIFMTNFGCNLEIYEPVPDFIDKLCNRFETCLNVNIYPYAVSDRDGAIRLNISGETTGMFGLGINGIDVVSVDISDLFTDQVSYFDCLEINIEGGEYAVMDRLISTKKIVLCNTILIQFHNYGIEQELHRARIRYELNKTHLLIKDYPWVWERWDLRNKL